MSDLADLTLPHTLEQRATTHGSNTFLRDKHGTLSYATMWDIARRGSVALAQLGVTPGDTVAIALENGREFITSWFSTACLGAIEVPINPEIVGEQLAYVLDHARAPVAIVESAMVPHIDEIAPRLEHLRLLIVVGPARSTTVTSVPFESLDGDVAAYSQAALTGADIAALMYTSGTTGAPKGVLLPHAQHYTNAQQAVTAADITSSDVVVVCLPLFHNMAQGYGVWPALLSGAAVGLLDRFDRSSFWDEVQRCEGTVFPFVGGLLPLLLDSDERPAPTHTLRVAYGVPIPASVHQRFEDQYGVRLLHCYGSTEATIPVWSDATCDRGAAGRTIDGFDVRILDSFDRVVPPGVIGEICIRAHAPYTMFQGYFRDPERTAAAWRNLWFHTGDRGEFDQAGQLWFRGRQHDVIRRFGEFIDPAQIEAVIEVRDDVTAAIAYGIPNTVAEEEVMVAVLPKNRAQPTATDIRTTVSQHLPRAWVPRYVSIVSELPTTPTGKVRRDLLRARGVTDDTDDARQPNRKE